VGADRKARIEFNLGFTDCGAGGESYVPFGAGSAPLLNQPVQRVALGWVEALLRSLFQRRDPLAQLAHQCREVAVGEPRAVLAGFQQTLSLSEIRALVKDVLDAIPLGQILDLRVGAGGEAGQIG
jgi:hypothetical protein